MKNFIKASNLSALAVGTSIEESLLILKYAHPLVVHDDVQNFAWEMDGKCKLTK